MACSSAGPTSTGANIPQANQPESQADSPSQSTAPTSVPSTTALAAPSFATPQPPTPEATATVYLSPTPFFTGSPSPTCGQLLPIVRQSDTPVVRELQTNSALFETINARMPTAARGAWRQILNSPENVGLVAYRMGSENEGVYINADVPMPLASVAKLIHLVAYAEAVAAGEVDPQSEIPLEDLNAFHLQGSNAGAHNRALRAMQQAGKVSDQETVQLEGVVEMMMVYSSNAATDYLHFLLGQQRLEQTVIDLGFTTHTAPCPFLTQFLAISNPVLRQPLSVYQSDPQSYSQEAGLLADAFHTNEQFRQTLGRWRAPLSAQRTFVAELSPQASAAEYAQLMQRLAQNGLSTPDSSFTARLHAEWPMRFQTNQDLFYNVGFKDGFLPGSLTLAYYAYPIGESTPLIVVLFFQDLPNQTYQQMRNSLSNDEFARWLLYDPEAIPLIRQAISP